MTQTPVTRLHSYHVITYGCQMNDHDSEVMSGILEARGMVRAACEQEADLVIVNTCVVREGAEERAVGRLAQMAALKKQHPWRVIAVAGCMAQRDAERLLERLPHVDLVVGTRDLYKIAGLIEQTERTGEQIVAVEDVDKPVFLDSHPVRRKNGLKALTTVMYGCNNFCSYCIVPTTRGREVSRPLGDVVQEIRQLADQGYKEVTLLGQNVNSYRHAGADFADLLAAVHDVTGLERIRFLTSHPKDCSERLLDAVASLEKVCEHFHLPAQAGSDRVLRRMNRVYTKQQYLELLDKVRARIPQAAITTDLIVGFPEESQEDFEQSYDLLERARWDSAFIFMYSPRAGTRAATWKDSVGLEEKKRRLQRCLARQEEISGEKNQEHVGRVEEILVESVSKRRETELVGRTRGDKCVIFPGEKAQLGQLVQVRISQAHPHTLFGQML